MTPVPFLRSISLIRRHKCISALPGLESESTQHLDRTTIHFGVSISSWERNARCNKVSGSGVVVGTMVLLREDVLSTQGLCLRTNKQRKIHTGLEMPKSCRSPFLLRREHLYQPTTVVFLSAESPSSSQNSCPLWLASSCSTSSGP